MYFIASLLRKQIAVELFKPDPYYHIFDMMLSLTLIY